MKNLELQTTHDIEHYLKSKQSILIPIGSTEQHGPTGLLGTDHLIPVALCNRISELTGVITAPPIVYGDSNHHMGFAGTITLRPSTLTLVVKDVISSLYTHGFKKIYFINGHGGNVSAVNCGIIESYLDYNDELDLRLISWWMADEVKEYEKNLFNNREGQHATCGEISITMYTHDGLVKAYNDPLDVAKFKHAWPLSAKLYKKTFPDGRMFSDITLCNKKLGEKLFNFTVETLIQNLELNVN